MTCSPGPLQAGSHHLASLGTVRRHAPCQRLKRCESAGKTLRYVGAAGALASVPAICVFTTLGLAASPTPAMLLVTETLRKVAVYSFAKPARELLFTRVSKDVKYKAKLVLDTVVQRSGDAAGAAIFTVLGTHMPRLHVRC